MMYEVLIPTTVAMVLLPFNFWSAAEIVLWVALVTVFWELRDAVLANPRHTMKLKELELKQHIAGPAD